MSTGELGETSATPHKLSFASFQAASKSRPVGWMRLSVRMLMSMFRLRVTGGRLSQVQSVFLAGETAGKSKEVLGLPEE